MNGYGIAGWGLIVLGATALIVQVFGRKDRRQPKASGGFVMLVVVGFILAAIGGALPEDDESTQPYMWLCIWLVVVAAASIIDRMQPWYARYKAIREEQRMARIIDLQRDEAPRVTTTSVISPAMSPAGEMPALAAPPPAHGMMSGLNIYVVLLYGRRGKKPERRQVIVHKVEIARDDDGRAVATMIEGYCQLRKAPRSFLVASIVEMSDGTTGEMIPHPSEWLLGRAMGH